MKRDNCQVWVWYNDSISSYCKNADLFNATSACIKLSLMLFMWKHKYRINWLFLDLFCLISVAGIDSALLVQYNFLNKELFTEWML